LDKNKLFRKKPWTKTYKKSLLNPFLTSLYELIKTSFLSAGQQSCLAKNLE
jgi:hypothetical protein